MTTPNCTERCRVRGKYVGHRHPPFYVENIEYTGPRPDPNAPPSLAELERIADIVLPQLLRDGEDALATIDWPRGRAGERDDWATTPAAGEISLAAQVALLLYLDEVRQELCQDDAERARAQDLAERIREAIRGAPLAIETVVEAGSGPGFLTVKLPEAITVALAALTADAVRRGLLRHGDHDIKRLLNIEPRTEALKQQGRLIAFFLLEHGFMRQ